MPEETENYPGNSKKSRAEETETEPKGPRKLEQIATGVIVKKKQSWLSKLSPDAQTVIGHVFWDIFVPAAKALTIEMIKSGLEMKFYGDSRPPRREADRIYTPYNSINAAPTPYGRGNLGYRQRATHDFSEILIPSYGKAEEILEALLDLIDKYQVARVSDFYDAVGFESSHADRKYGWDDLSRATIRPIHGGFFLDLPRPMPLD